ncbi:F-box only protein 10 isoform X4 [Dermochelys coriacea]|uniref:F-box only protein 10 isoform X4 n=1 Tax=Dermochelys coriacea TaxID=27794 RepID=UPI001CA9A374|nr:F-box only protein 10 isoform X4 [Dermochelys coriacea]
MEISGLPVELWRLILSYLRLPDLGRCSLVCRAWYELILSLDNTRWRQLCLGCIECRHPNWPNQPHVEPQSWREAFKQHYVASKTWTKNTQDFESSHCFYLFRRKKDRRVLHVGQGCEFDTLRAGLASADVYDRIVLLPGVYEEQSEIILKVPVEIMGQGKLGDVALLVSIDQHCPTTRLCNVVFMPAWFTPVVYKIIMLKNDIHHCRASGIFLRLAAGGLIADNNIHSNCEAGVDIRKGANPLILCNKIHSGLRSGIVVLGNGKGIIRSNQIYRNKEAGIYILYNGNPIVSGNHIFQGLAAGIAVNENGRGQIIENVIRENQWGGADIRRGGDPVLRSNLICCGYSDGVVVGERGKGLIEGNTIYGNKGCGVWIMSSSLPHITNNRICHNSIYGVAVFCRKDDANDYLANQGGNENFNDEGEAASWENDLDSEDERFTSRRPISVALVESNSINHNGAAGLYVKSSEALNIIANAIHANHDSGVAVLQSSQLTRIANNSISCNSLGGVLIESEARVELRGNGIYDNSSHGITSKGDGVVIENDIIGNRGCGLRLLQTADMKVTKNRIQSFWDYGIVMLDQTKGLVQENLIFQGRTKKTILQQVSNAEDCIVQNNKLLTFKSKSDVAWTLENPPARPHIEGSTRGNSSATNSHKVTTMSTRIAAQMDGGCHNNGSIFCTIL